MKKAVVIIIGALFALVALAVMFLPKADFSDSERRALEKFPSLKLENVLSGEYGTDFEKASLDRFPARDFFRAVKSAVSLYILGQTDVNGLYVEKGHISKVESSINQSSIDNAHSKFEYIKNTYAKDIPTYLAIIPDKHFYLANGRESMDYEKFIQTVKAGMDYAEYIDLTKALDFDSYYRTDSHWKQEELGNVVKALGEKLGFEDKEYASEKVSDTFYGVYAGQLALAQKPDIITKADVPDVRVYHYNGGAPTDGVVYDESKLTAKDPFDYYLSGQAPVTVIENKNAPEREIVILRDSFAGPLAPLLSEYYSKITLIDIRYIPSSMIGQFVSFEKTDELLFLYSTTLINRSSGMK